MRRTLLIGALALSLSGCGMAPGLMNWSADAPTPSTPSTPPASSSPSPTPTPTSQSPSATASPTATPSATSAGVTVSQAGQALRQWVDKYNAMLTKRKWWRSNARLDALFVEGALHEGVLERNHEDFGWKTGHKPIHPTGTPVIYLPRPEQQSPAGDWFIAQATYKDTEGHARPHVLGFIRSQGQPFRLAVATPVHWGQRIPKPLLDADGYITDMDGAMARAVAEEYRNFWNGERKKEGDSGYRLARNSYSRKAFPKVNKGLYVGFAGHGSIFGFRTADGGSFFLFAMINDPKSVNNVLSEALLVPKGSRTIQELGADWFS
ncbi:hypothetical protein FH608_018235 [Nonomuraea phyllanthi]|uniref:DUF8094 domain-containing protein n=1 Tax=Nonomuraea phyllanthi TaxID=2219224 RepID=A0A5C4WHN9_9ACTN|nr:hypothetical protein [Nonomuraea phyllanthi]KAB8194117.1 hypothetical protein FH608_018235 [Nonomuraea phyllanthi]